MRFWPLSVALLMVSAVQAAQLSVPSGQDVALQEVILDADGNQNTYRFRFVTPGLKRGDLAEKMAEIETDMAQLCDQYALPFMAENGDVADQVVVSFADRETVFGVATPDATQVYEIYSIIDNKCVWEPF